MFVSDDGPQYSDKDHTVKHEHDEKRTKEHAVHPISGQPAAGGRGEWCQEGFRNMGFMKKGFRWK